MARKGEESKQGLIITLVVFVILSICLGVTAYFGFNQQGALNEEKKKLAADKKAADNERNWYKFQALLYRSYLGQAPSKDDLDYVVQKRGDYEGGKLPAQGDEKEDVDKLIKKMDADPDTGWDAEKKLPRRTYFAALADLNKRLNDAAAKLQQTESDDKKQLDQLNANLATLQKEKDDLAAKLADANKQIVDAKEKKSAELVKALKDVDNAINELEDLKQKVQLANEDKNKAVGKKLKEVGDLKIQIEKLKDQITPPSLLDNEQPKGKIVHLDRAGNVAYINLGSEDNIKPELRFSVFSAGTTPKSGRERKAALQVAQVLQPHLSMARISDVTDPRGDPVVTGDQLYNPTWSSALREHVAIAGVIDLTGLGRDDMPTFIRALERQGVVVDAYLDLKDRAIKGKGIGIQTSYLILGEEPSLENYSLGKDEAENRADPRVALLGKISDMKADAARLGITIVPVRRFLSLTGYQMPRITVNGKGSHYDAIPSRGVSTEAKEPAKDAAKEGTGKEDKEKADKETPKDKGDKEAGDEDAKAPPKKGKPKKDADQDKDDDKGKDKDKEEKEK
jgi:hypothetical protein